MQVTHKLHKPAHSRGGRRYLRLGGGAPTVDNTVRPYYLCTDGGVCASTHMLGGSGGMLPQKIFF